MAIDSVLVQHIPKEDEERAGDSTLLHHFFERAVRKWPGEPALDVPPGSERTERRIVSYEELDRQSHVLANRLASFVTGECVVAILLPRTDEYLLVSQLAVLRSGAAYTCIDPAFPDEQVRDILADAQAVVLLTDEEGASRAINCGYDPANVFDVSRDIALPVAHMDPSQVTPRPEWLTENSLAYVIYTSGTTGRPKGVMIEHRSIANLVASDIPEFNLKPGDRVAQSSSSAYDSSIEETWLALAAGATVVILDDETARLGPDLVEWLRRERITVLCPPPTLLRTLSCENPETDLPELSLLYVGGEALTSDVADRWAKDRRLVNGYGPTECTVTCVRATITPGEQITIGWPIRGLQAWVLSESLEEVEDGVKGELCIGGIGLARGYRNRPELNESKFPTHPQLGRIYRTGDLVHRGPDGPFIYHGRIDSQVKLRGYRVELEAIEARLAECEGVREAACKVQQDGAQQTLAAFVVPEDDQARQALSYDNLKASLRRVLPTYMVPTRFATLSELPTTIAGKLDRLRLPTIDGQWRNNGNASVSPRNQVESRIDAALRDVLRIDNISVHDDFFNDLGGDSLHAAELISVLRDDRATASITVRDLYEARTVEALALRARAGEGDVEDHSQAVLQRGKPVIATILQTVWLLTALLVASAASYVAGFELLPRLVTSLGLGLVSTFALGPFIVFAALSVYIPIAVLFSVLVKKALIGRYRPLRAPVWGSFYVRNWIVQRTLRIIPWRLIAGTVFQVVTLRMLGARIGKRVHIHRGVELLQGGWDLLVIEDDVTLSQDASIRLVDFDEGDVIVGSVFLGAGSTLDVRAGVGGNTRLDSEAYLTASSFLSDGERIPRGEQWDGIPARPAGKSPSKPSVRSGQRELSSLAYSLALLVTRLGVVLVFALAIELPALVLMLIYGVDAESVFGWLLNPSFSGSILAAAILMSILPVPIAAVLGALALRGMGKVHPGVINRWSMSYMRVSLKTEILQWAGKWLSGSLMWLMWLRLAGTKIGRGCEISTIIDVVPELIEIGDECFFADGIYLGGPRVHRGAVKLGKTTLSDNTFLGNHAVIAAGQRLPEDILLGVCTIADEEQIRPGTSWFGLPLFELPRREIVEVDRRLTHEPSMTRYLNRWFWEVLRFGLPLVPVIIISVWFASLAAIQSRVPGPALAFVVAPLLNLAAIGFLCLLVLTMKWILLGRVRPGVHPLWSCWCSRWDFLYVAWGFYASTALSLLEGTLLLTAFLRAMGAKIGKRVVLGGGFAQVVDPDMLHFEDGSTVNCQFQAHTFEDRVLKIDHVRIGEEATVGSSAVLLYGAHVGARSRVAPHSVVMKHEGLLPGHSYAGFPTRPTGHSYTPQAAASGTTILSELG
jgi:non-ribosomal peptide synthetase-like protein